MRRGSVFDMSLLDAAIDLFNSLNTYEQIAYPLLALATIIMVPMTIAAGKGIGETVGDYQRNIYNLGAVNAQLDDVYRDLGIPRPTKEELDKIYGKRL